MPVLSERRHTVSEDKKQWEDLQTEDEPDVEGHRLQTEDGMVEDKPDVEGHMLEDGQAEA